MNNNMQDEDKNTNAQSTTEENMPKEEWIVVSEGKFTCPECEHTSIPQTNTVDGIVDADLDKIKSDLEQFPTKIIYGICPVCGMEYVFKLVEGKLYLEPSEEEK